MKKISSFFLGCLAGIAITYLFLQYRYDKKSEKMALEISLDKVSAKRKELLQAWEASQKFTLKIVNQMPDEYFGFKYTQEAMTFAEQWRHCAIFTCNQLAGRFELKDNPYEDKSKRPPVEMDH